MAATQIVADEPAQRKQLVCNCRRVVSRAGETRTFKSRAWDCPSCGLDKRNRLTAMCELADATVLASLTFAQPYYERGSVPPEHQWCDPERHVYRYRDGSHRWRVIGTCDHCCRRVSKMLEHFRKRVRRRYGDSVDYLRVYEDQENGALHIHLAFVGLPAVLPKRPLWLKAQWSELGGGFSDFNARTSPKGSALGRYLGKYLAKRQEQRMARGFRRWSRTAGFAPEVRMRTPPAPEWVPEPWLCPEAELKHVGWVRADTGEVVATRFWEDETDSG